MSLIILASAKGAPGVTTTALALAMVWPAERGLLLVEGDPAGSALAPRFGLNYEPGVMTLAPLARHSVAAEVIQVGAADPRGQLQQLPIGLGRPAIDVLIGSPSYEYSRGLAPFWARLASYLRESTKTDVLADCGRLVPDSPAMALLEAADLTLLLTRSDVESVTHTRRRLDALGATALGLRKFAVVVLGSRPYRSDDVAEAVGVPVLGTIAEDPAGAAALGRNARTHSPISKSRLARSARTLYDSLEDHLVQLGPFDRGSAPPV